jgi:hypothetical protein
MLKRTCLSLFLLAAVACGDSGTTSPSPTLTPTSTAPTPLKPADGAHFSVYQSLTFVVGGTLSDGSTVEVARDPAFSQPVFSLTYASRLCGKVFEFTCDVVGANGQHTSMPLGTDSLTGGDYYWHVNVSGVFSPAFKFTLDW